MCAEAPTQLVSGERLGENVDISRQKHIYSKMKKLGRLLAQPLLLSVSSPDEEKQPWLQKRTGWDGELSYTIRGRMEACLRGDVAPVTLPFNKDTGAQLTLINSCPHTTCTHMQPEIMEVCKRTQPALSLLGSVCVCVCVGGSTVSHPLVFPPSPSHTWK